MDSKIYIVASQLPSLCMSNFCVTSQGSHEYKRSNRSTVYLFEIISKKKEIKWRRNVFIAIYRRRKGQENREDLFWRVACKSYQFENKKAELGWHMLGSLKRIRIEKSKLYKILKSDNNLNYKDSKINVETVQDNISP